MKRETTTEICPADPILRVIAGRWKTHIVYLLGQNGPARFNVIQRRLVPISPKVLTSRLRELADDGLIWREQEATIPPKVTYGLTDLGREVHEVLKSFDAVGRKLGSVPTTDLP
ncbi:helix-turn-helix domain-containing protein [Roseovarius sp. Pro17]|uniref:winged helix-turn-helix transcriptional regulator n=1 Tax=Roseovarius sp. Pro17 TaxID=3108175 RepID=UPI002D7A3FE8|nr:helix-turn-helix domain-containing protein [Roseovarius sp. Pro17]